MDEMSLEVLRLAAEVCSCLTGIGTLALLVSRSLRERLLGLHRLRQGLQCLLRSSMLRTYYRNREDRTIRQYEYENFLCEYRAYKSLRGNSFVDRIYEEVKGWDIIT